MTTRFATLSPRLARLVLLAVAALVALGLMLSASPLPAPKLGAAGANDVALYHAIAARSATLPDYYASAAAEQRARGYPLKPFVTVREPALALLTHRLGLSATAIAYRLLALSVLAALLWRLRAVAGRGERIAAIALAAASVLLLAQAPLATWHEAWAGMLVALAVSMRTPGRWWPACLIGLTALLIRELALPSIAALAILALIERRRGEAAGWVAVAAVFAVMLAAHAAAVSAHLMPGDRASPGWAQAGGWRFVLSAAQGSSLFMLAPTPLVALLLPLALLGWAAPASPFADRVAAVLVATLVPFTIVGRPDNFYWGLVVAPLLPIGLAFAPAALRQLARQARAKSPSVRAWPASASS